MKLSSHQDRGLRPQHSTKSMTLHILSDITQTLNDKGMVGGVFIDLKKRPYTINHNLLLDKLKCYGLEACELDGLKSESKGF